MKHFLLQLLACFIVLSGYTQVTFTESSGTAQLRDFGSNYGIAFGDFDQDGWEDIYLSRRSDANRLYRNLGNGTFENVASDAGVAFAGDTKMAVWGDLNNDGWQDLFLANKSEGDMIYLNNRNGTFEDITSTAGLSETGRCKAVMLGDLNNDGWLDIYVAREYEENTLYINQGDNTFVDIIENAGAKDIGLAMGSILFDFDNDNDLDIYLTHDAYQPNILYRNNGDLTFTDISEESGTNYAGYGMGVDVADVNNDGWLDIYITNLSHNTLYINNQDGTFTNKYEEANVGDIGMGWGTVFMDCDNDGWQDIYVANNPPFPNVCYQNIHNGTFSLISEDTPLASIGNGYGLATADLNNDGGIDFLVANLNDTIGNELFINGNETPNQWIKIKPIGTQSNWSGIGARITIEIGDLVLTDEVNSGASYASQNSLIMHFGLGEIEMIDRIKVRWPSGIIDELTDVIPNQLLEIEEGSNLVNNNYVTSIQELQLFPNPFTDQTNLSYHLDKNTAVQIRILDASGQVFWQQTEFQTTGLQQWQLDLAELPRGFYFCKLTTTDGTITQKIIKY